MHCLASFLLRFHIDFVRMCHFLYKAYMFPGLCERGDHSKVSCGNQFFLCLLRGIVYCDEGIYVFDRQQGRKQKAEHDDCETSLRSSLVNSAGGHVVKREQWFRCHSLYSYRIIEDSAMALLRFAKNDREPSYWIRLNACVRVS